jgi:hypothetical protein
MMFPILAATFRMHPKDYKEQFVSLMDSCGSIGTCPTLRPQAAGSQESKITIAKVKDNPTAPRKPYIVLRTDLS